MIRKDVLLLWVSILQDSDTFVIRVPLYSDSENECVALHHPYHDRYQPTIFSGVEKSKATKVLEICSNEFGEQSHSFTAPNGYEH